ncbi:hypothetical protein AN239_05650, partial [Neisseria gonorrhoeae]
MAAHNKLTQKQIEAAKADGETKASWPTAAAYICCCTPRQQNLADALPGTADTRKNPALGRILPRQPQARPANL